MEKREPMKNSKVIFPWKLASGILDAVEEAAIELEDGNIDERINAFGYAKTSHSFPIFRISIWLLNQFDAENINVHYRFPWSKFSPKNNTLIQGKIIWWSWLDQNSMKWFQMKSTLFTRKSSPKYPGGHNMLHIILYAAYYMLHIIWTILYRPIQ